MSDRRPVFDAPFGSPAAGTVAVYRIDPETGEKTLVREEDPFDSDLQPHTTLPGGPGSELAKGQQPFTDAPE
jgi:hypothetical protein